MLDEVVQEVVNMVGSCIRLATPLGIGKPIPLVNAVYQRSLDPDGEEHTRERRPDYLQHPI